MADIKRNISYNQQNLFKPIMGAYRNFLNTLPKKKIRQTTQQYAPLQSRVAAKTGKGTITTPYGGSTKYESFHPGVDIARGMGTPIGAFAPGKVTQVVGGQGKGSPGFGNYVIITDAQGNQQRYSHLQNEYVKVGQQVGAGSVIGTEGNTGQTYSLHGGSGSHLDYRVKNIYGKYVNPNPFLSNYQAYS